MHRIVRVINNHFGIDRAFSVSETPLHPVPTGTMSEPAEIKVFTKKRISDRDEILAFRRRLVSSGFKNFRFGPVRDNYPQKNKFIEVHATTGLRPLLYTLHFPLSAGHQQPDVRIQTHVEPHRRGTPSTVVAQRIRQALSR